MSDGAIGRRVLTGLVVVLLVVASSCSTTVESEDLPGILCNDGYVAHPDYGHDEDGCGPHGGARNEFIDGLNAYLDAAPNTPASHYVCRDGWISRALYQQGACSHHGGVWRLGWPDGTEIILNGPGAPAVVRPDGTVVEPWSPSPTG